MIRCSSITLDKPIIEQKIKTNLPKETASHTNASSHTLKKNILNKMKKNNSKGISVILIKKVGGSADRRKRKRVEESVN